MFAVEHIPGLKHEQILRLMEALAGLHSFLMKRDDKSYVESFVEGAHGRETFSEGMQNMMVGFSGFLVLKLQFVVKLLKTALILGFVN